MSVCRDEQNALASTMPLGHIGEVEETAGALKYVLTSVYFTV